MAKAIDDLLATMRNNPRGVRFSDAILVATFYFGEPRQSAGSHCVFRMPWPGDPRINLENDGGKAKAYQIRQLLLAVERLRSLRRDLGKGGRDE